jgi:hypothetical protein
VLDYAATYFQLGPIERRIYEVARSTCVPGEPLTIDLPTFRLQIGFQNQLANFRMAMRQIAAVNAVPDYDLQLVEDPAPPQGGSRGRKTGQARVVITRRPSAPELAGPGLTDGGSLDPLGPDPTSTAEAAGQG